MKQIGQLREKPSVFVSTPPSIPLNPPQSRSIPLNPAQSRLIPFKPTKKDQTPYGLRQIFNANIETLNAPNDNSAPVASKPASAKAPKSHH